MRITRFPIEGLILIEPKVFEDNRGFFFEFFNDIEIKALIGENYSFVQDNISCSKKDVLRGLHFQLPPHAQGKLVSVLKGRVLDVGVDLRKDSGTYGKHQMAQLDAIEKKMFWIPPGFAHGFIALEDDTLFAYKCTSLYAPAAEATLLWNDADLMIDWSIEQPILSEKDKMGIKFRTFESPF